MTRKGSKPAIYQSCKFWWSVSIFAMIFQMYLLCRMDRYCAVWISMTTFGEISCRATLTSSFQIKSSSKNQGLYSQVWKKFMSNETWYKICKNIKLKYLNMGPINGFKDKVREAREEAYFYDGFILSWIGIQILLRDTILWVQRFS